LFVESLKFKEKITYFYSWTKRLRSWQEIHRCGRAVT